MPECGATAASGSCPAACPDCACTRHLASSRTPALLQPRSQTIIEAHPDVYKYACSQGWDSKPGVRLVLGRWQDVMDQVGFKGGGEGGRRAAARLWRVQWPAIPRPLCGMLFPQPPAAAWLLLLLLPPTAACTWSIQQLHKPRPSALCPSCSCPLQLGPFDGIFFDTYGEYYEDMHDFHTQLPRWVQKRVGFRHVPLPWSECMPGTGVQVQGSSRSPVLLYLAVWQPCPHPLSTLHARRPLHAPTGCCAPAASTAFSTALLRTTCFSIWYMER